MRPRPTYLDRKVRERLWILIPMTVVIAVFVSLGFMWWVASVGALAMMALLWILFREGGKLDLGRWLQGRRGEGIDPRATSRRLCCHTTKVWAREADRRK